MGRHTRTKADPQYPSPLVETWETARTWNLRPPTTWAWLTKWVRRAERG